MTAENCSDFMTRWKDSKLFDFGALYQEEGMCHSYIGSLVSRLSCPHDQLSLHSSSEGSWCQVCLPNPKCTVHLSNEEFG